MPKSIRWLGHASFIVSTPGGKTIIIDPWIVGNPVCPIKLDEITSANIVLVTHDHFDHIGNAADIINNTGATLVAQPESVNKYKDDLGIPSDRIVFGGAKPLFKERIAVFDSRRVDTLMVIPI